MYFYVINKYPMKNFTLLTIFSFAFQLAFAQTNHDISAQGSTSWNPSNLTINLGDSVTWTNNGAGLHDLNGTTTTFPDNPESFSMPTESTNWVFGKRFNVPGVYSYRCDIHTMMQGQITVVDPSASISKNTFASVTIGPNPATEFITFKTEATDFEIEVYDILGNRVIKQRMKNQSQLSISHLPQGMYLVEIKIGEAYIKKRMIKK